MDTFDVFLSNEIWVHITFSLKSKVTRLIACEIQRINDLKLLEGCDNRDPLFSGLFPYLFIKKHHAFNFFSY